MVGEDEFSFAFQLRLLLVLGRPQMFHFFCQAAVANLIRPQGDIEGASSFHT